MSTVSTQFISEIMRLSPPDRLALISAIWESLADSELGVTEEERALLDERKADMGAHPEDEIAAALYRDNRRVVVRVFPYLLWFRLLNGCVVILACVHARRSRNTCVAA